MVSPRASYDIGRSLSTPIWQDSGFASDIVLTGLRLYGRIASVKEKYRGILPNYWLKRGIEHEDG